METFESSPMNHTVAARFEQMAATYPTQVALQTAHLCWSYAELNQHANQIAHRLVAHRGDGQGQVAIFCATLAWQVAATLAVIKSGKTVVMLDTTLPTARLRLIIADAQVERLLVDTPLVTDATALTHGTDGLSLPMLQVDTIPTASPCENLPQTIAPTDPLVLLYTSGSTGQPKGVIITHQAELHSAWSKQQTLPLGPHPRGAVISSLAYAATWGMAFRLLLCGGCLCEYKLLTNGFTQFATWLETEQITLLIPPIALMRQWCQTLATPLQLPHLRAMEFIGALVTKQDLIDLRAKFVGTYSLTLLYGSTEALNVTAYRVPDVHALPADPLPGGYVVPDKQVLILDESGRPVAQGQNGEIVIQSRYIAPGYWQRAELTRAKFSTCAEDPTQQAYFTGDLGYQDASGCLYITGRKDAMVKLRGYAVDLTEVEQTLAALPAVQQAVVKVDEQQTEATLIAYVVLEASATVTDHDLRQQLAQRLPAYMLPARFIQRAALPLTPNGKIDRQALVAPTPTRPRLDTPYGAPRTTTERQLAAMWCSLLGLEGIGIHDNFFALGGHSLLAMRLLAWIEQEFGKKFPIHRFLFVPTIAQLADLLRPAEIGKPATLALAQASLTAAQHSALQQIVEQLADPTQPQTWQQVLQSTAWARRHKTSSKALSRLPHPLLRLCLNSFLHLPWYQQRFRQEIALIAQFFAVIDPCHRAGTESIAKSLRYNCYARYGLLPRVTNTPLASGEEILNAAQANERGVILVAYHDLLANKFDHPRLKGTFLIGGVHTYLAYHQIRNPDIQATLFAQQLHGAHQQLLAGGLVQILPDGHIGRGEGIRVDFHGRYCRFRSTFAELALMTGAAVIAVAGELDHQEQVRIHLLGPLDAGAETMPQAERVARLVNQYVALLNQMWTKTPWLVPCYQMRSHLAHPPSNE